MVTQLGIKDKPQAIIVNDLILEFSQTLSLRLPSGTLLRDQVNLVLARFTESPTMNIKAHPCTFVPKIEAFHQKPRYTHQRCHF